MQAVHHAAERAQVDRAAVQVDGGRGRQGCGRTQRYIAAADGCATTISVVAGNGRHAAAGISDTKARTADRAGKRR